MSGSGLTLYAKYFHGDHLLSSAQELSRISKAPGSILDRQN